MIFKFRNSCGVKLLFFIVEHFYARKCMLFGSHLLHKCVNNYPQCLKNNPKRSPKTNPKPNPQMGHNYAFLSCFTAKYVVSYRCQISLKKKNNNSVHSVAKKKEKCILKLPKLCLEQCGLRPRDILTFE